MSKVAIQGNISGTGTLTIASPNTNTDHTLTLPDSAGTIATLGTTLTLATAVASTSGTSIDFTGIPSYVKRITVMLNGVSLNGSSALLVQFGDAGGFETTGYQSSSSILGSVSFGSLASTAGFIIFINTASFSLQGAHTFSKITGNAWVASGSFSYAAADNFTIFAGGGKTLSDTLTQVRITTVNGTDTFDAGTINIMYEG